jgi:flagellar biosynthesis protein FliR
MNSPLGVPGRVAAAVALIVSVAVAWSWWTDALDWVGEQSDGLTLGELMLGALISLAFMVAVLAVAIAAGYVVDAFARGFRRGMS